MDLIKIRQIHCKHVYGFAQSFCTEECFLGRAYLRIQSECGEAGGCYTNGFYIACI